MIQTGGNAGGVQAQPVPNQQPQNLFGQTQIPPIANVPQPAFAGPLGPDARPQMEAAGIPQPSTIGPSASGLVQQPLDYNFAKHLARIRRAFPRQGGI